MTDKSHPKSIELPDTVRVFDNLKNAKRFAIDIGKHFIVTKDLTFTLLKYK
jgi:hypothetical protein